MSDMDTKPPFLLESTWWRLNFSTHTHLSARQYKAHLYHILIRSQNNCFVIIYSSSEFDRVDTQFEESLSWLITLNLFYWSFKLSLKLLGINLFLTNRAAVIWFLCFFHFFPFDLFLLSPILLLDVKLYQSISIASVSIRIF